MDMDKQRKDKLRKKIKLFGTIFKFALLILIVIGLPLYIYFFPVERNRYTEEARSR